jgi:hypothetical protein
MKISREFTAFLRKIASNNKVMERGNYITLVKSNTLDCTQWQRELWSDKRIDEIRKYHGVNIPFDPTS